MQSAWDNSEGPGADTSPPVNEPAKKTAQELGWTAPTPINYEAAKSKDPIQPSHQITAQYEWDGAVGDLGPEASPSFVKDNCLCSFLHVIAFSSHHFCSHHCLYNKFIIVTDV